MNSLIWWIGIPAVIAGLLIWEDSRDWMIEAFQYIFSFEWLGDFFGFISEMFEGIGEFSITGLVLGLVGVLTIYLARSYMLYPFLDFMGPMEAIIWGAATYIGTFIAGYLVGKGFDNTG